MSAETGFLPRMANRMLMVTTVRPIAINGETSAIVFDRSARFSSTNCMGCVLLQAASAHQQAKLFAAGFAGGERLRKSAMKHHGDPVGDFGELVEVLAGDEHGGACGREIKHCLADDGGCARINAPGRLADNEHGGISKNLAADDELLQIAARQARSFRIAFGLAYVESLCGAVNRL